jgi:hypothetical protein
MAKKVVKKATKKVTPKKVEPKKKLKKEQAKVKENIKAEEITQKLIDESIEQFKNKIKPGDQFLMVVWSKENMKIIGAHSPEQFHKLFLSMINHQLAKLVK